MPRIHSPRPQSLGGFFLHLFHRADELRLSQTASSLSFSWLLALVPMLTLMLAVVAQLPYFSQMNQAVLNDLLGRFLPEPLGEAVHATFRNFVKRAGSLSVVGLLMLTGAVITMIITVDRTLSSIWGSRRHRGLIRRVVVYAIVVLLGPVAALTLAGGAAIASDWLIDFLFEFGQGLGLDELTGLRRWIPDWITGLTVPLTLLAYTVAYRFLPHAQVRLRDALVGAAVVSFAGLLVREGFAAIFTMVPTYRLIYGPLVAVPMLLIWTYLGWLLFILGALITAELPLWRNARRQRLIASGITHQTGDSAPLASPHGSPVSPQTSKEQP